MEKSKDLAALIVVTLRCIAITHQTNHWIYKGKTFYGNHEMFDRLYQSALEDTDSAAEKFMGLFGEGWLNVSMQASLIGKVLSNYAKIEDNVSQSLQIEKDFVKLLKQSQDAFEANGDLTLGLADMLGNISSSRETAIYLLQQSQD